MSILSPQSWRKRSTSHTALDQKLVGSFSGFKIPRLRQIKYLPKLLSAPEYRIIKILGVIVVVNLLFLGWKAYVARTEIVPRFGGTYTEGLVGAPAYINPLFLQSNDSDRDLVRLIYSGLMTYTKERTIAADLATGYTIAPDGKQYTFTLRRDVVWHDGEPFTADDVVFTLEKIKDSKTKSPLYSSYKDIGIKKTDQYTVQFTLDKPFAPFLDLATLPIMPRHAWEELSPEKLPLASLNLKPIGSGPWKFKSFQKDQDGTIRSYTIVRNDEYYGVKPYIEKVVFKFYPDTQSIVEGLKNRHIDGAGFLSSEERRQLAKDRELADHTLVLPQYTALFFNSTRKSELNSAAVRKALALAIDKNTLVADAFGGEARVIYGPILEGFVGYHNNLERHAFNLAAAKETLAGEGWNSNDKGELVKKSRKGEITRLSLELAVPDTSTSGAVADRVKEMWGALGIAVTVNRITAADIKESVIDPRAYDVLLYGALIGSDPDLYPFWHSSQSNAPGLNLAQFADKNADRLLEQARQETNEEKRGSLYRSFQEILAQEVPAVFLYSPTYSYIMKRAVKGVADQTVIAYPADRFTDLGHWYIKARREFKK